jgi:hypothetical protein
MEPGFIGLLQLEGSGQLHVQVAIPPEKEPPGLDGPHNLSGRYSEVNILDHTGIPTRILGRPAPGSQTTLRILIASASELYRLSDRHLLAKFSANFCG